jgi:hypothetical protein
MGLAGQFWQEVIGSRFSFEGIRLTLPTETFNGEMTLQVGDASAHYGRTDLSGADISKNIVAGKVVLCRRKKGGQKSGCQKGESHK